MNRLRPLGFSLALLLPVFGASGQAAQDSPAAEDPAGPTVRLLSPTARDAAAGEMRIQADVEGARPGDSLNVFVDGKKVATLTGPPWSTSWQAGAVVRRHQVTVVLVRGGREVAKAHAKTRDLGFASSAGAHAVGLAPIVTDRDGHPVPGLTKTDFSILDEGEAQEIDTFDTLESPLAVILVMDASESMIPKQEEARRAAHAFLDAIKPGDDIGLYTFSSSLTGMIDLTRDRARLHAALDEVRPSGATALYDATAAAIRRLKPVKKRKAAVLFTDGEDNQSRLSVDQVIDIARASEVSIFSVALKPRETGSLRVFLDQLAEQTGGRALFIGNIKKLTEGFREVLAELKSQYFLTYTPKAQLRPRTWRRIQIRVRRPELQVRAKKEYFVE